MKKFLTLAVLLSAFILGAGEVIFDGSTPDAWSERVTVENGLLIGNLGFQPLYSKEFIPVTRGKKYTITGEFRVIGTPPKATTIFFGFTPFTADGQIITHCSVATVNPQVLTTLAADAKAGDKVLILKDAANWQFLAHGRLAFNAKTDRSDLPNMDLSPFFDLDNIKVKEDGSVEVALKRPLTKDYPAGTVVRQHRAGHVFIYAGIDNKANEWMSFSKTINNFYVGTTQIKVTVRFLQRSWPVEFRNIKVIAE